MCLVQPPSVYTFGSYCSASGCQSPYARGAQRLRQQLRRSRTVHPLGQTRASERQSHPPQRPSAHPRSARAWDRTRHTPPQTRPAPTATRISMKSTLPLRPDRHRHTPTRTSIKSTPDHRRSHPAQQYQHRDRPGTTLLLKPCRNNRAGIITSAPGPESMRRPLLRCKAACERPRNSSANLPPRRPMLPLRPLRRRHPPAPHLPHRHHRRYQQR